MTKEEATNYKRELTLFKSLKKRIYKRIFEVATIVVKARKPKGAKWGYNIPSSLTNIDNIEIHDDCYITVSWDEYCMGESETEYVHFPVEYLYKDESEIVADIKVKQEEKKKEREAKEEERKEIRDKEKEERDKKEFERLSKKFKK